MRARRAWGTTPPISCARCPPPRPPTRTPRGTCTRRGCCVRGRSSRDVAGLTEKASRFPARVFEPVSSRLGVPRIERLRRPRRAAGHELPAAGDLERAASCSSCTTSRSGSSRRPRRTWTPGGCGGSSDWLATGRARHRAVEERGELTSPSSTTWTRRGSTRSTTASTRTRSGRPPTPAVAEVRRRFGIAGPYALFVGGIEPRKNLERLVRAFGRLRGLNDVSLVIAGGPRPVVPAGRRAARGGRRRAAGRRPGPRDPHRLREPGRQGRAHDRRDPAGVSLPLRGLRVPGDGGVRRRPAGADLERLVAARGRRRRRRCSSTPTTRRRSRRRWSACSRTATCCDDLAAAGVARVSAFTWEATARARRREPAPGPRDGPWVDSRR